MFAQLGVEQLQQLRGADNPWLLVTSFVNPHDITLWGSLALAGDLSGAQGSFYLAEQLVGSNVPRDLFGPAYTQSTNEDLSTKPVAQKSFVSQYPKAFQPLRNDTDYHRFYYQLQKNVDEQIGKVINALTDDRKQYRDTIVIYLSDHGEMLGRARRHVPEVACRVRRDAARAVHVPQPGAVPHSPEQRHPHQPRRPHPHDARPRRTRRDRCWPRSCAPPTPRCGDSSARTCRATCSARRTATRFERSPVYFMTDDQPFKGANAVSLAGLPYQPVDQPNCVETVVAYLPTGPTVAPRSGGSTRGTGTTRSSGRTPNVQDVMTFIPGPVNQPGTKVAQTTVKAANPTSGQVAPPADQFELYNATVDPAELTNLYGNPDYSATQQLLAKLLGEQRDVKRLTPVQQPWADGSMQQFPFTPS